MKKIILAISAIALISQDVLADASTTTYNNCICLCHKKRETDTKVSYNEPGSSYQVITSYYQDSNGNWQPVYSTYYNLAGWIQKDKDHDGACSKGSAHCQSSTTQNIPNVGNKTAIAEAWNNNSQGTAITQIAPHSTLKAGADDNTPNPTAIVDGITSSTIQFDNDMFNDHAIFKLNGGDMFASKDFFTNLKVIVCIKREEGEIEDIIDESELIISNNGVTKTGIFSQMSFTPNVTSDGIKLTLSGTEEISIPVPAAYQSNENVCIVVVTDGGYQSTYTSNKSTINTMLTQVGTDIIPNPTFNGAFTINIDNEIISGENKIVVTDINGRTIQKLSVSNQKSILLSNLPKGMLFVEITNGKNKVVKKVFSN